MWTWVVIGTGIYMIGYFVSLGIITKGNWERLDNVENWGDYFLAAAWPIIPVCIPFVGPLVLGGKIGQLFDRSLKSKES